MKSDYRPLRRTESAIPAAFFLLIMLAGCIVPPAPQAGPGAVTGMSPGNEATVSDANPILSWTPVPGATRYEVKIAETQEGLDAAKPIETGTAYHTPKGGLKTGKTYYWRVRALDGSGRAGKWSPDRTLRISTITGMQPSDGAATFNPTPTLSWTAAAGIYRYEVQIAERPGFRGAVPAYAAANRFTPQTPLAGDKTYFWRVRTAETDDRTGRWSTTFSLRLGTGAVTGMAPPNGAATTDTTPTLSWTAPTGAARYEVQLADTAEGLAGAAASTVPTTAYTPSTALTSGETYYWRVRAVAGDRTTGSWSRPFTLKVSWAAITGMSPPSGTETSETAPTLSWTPVPGASRYEVQHAETSTGIADAAAKTVHTSAYTPSPPLTSGKTHYWRVRALDSAGNPGAWSRTSSLAVIWGGVTGMAPADGDASADTTPTLSWNAVPEASGYQLQLADSPRNVSTAEPKSVQGTTYTPTAPLAGGKTHYWRVRALGDGRTGKWSKTFALQVSWAVITGLSPVSGTLTTDTTPTLSWTAATGASGYEVQIAGTPAEVPNATAKSVQAASYTPSAPLAFKIHHWRVRALVSAGTPGAWSRVHSLQVYWGAVTGMSPASGATTTDTTPTLSWTAATGAIRYDVQTAETPDFANPTTASSRGTTYTPAAALTNGKTHYWRVRAADAKDQTGEWSAANSLHVNWGAVTGMAPPNGSATTDTTPKLNWTSVAGASRYQVQIADTSAALTSASATTATATAARYTPSPALALKTHYWRVRAVAADGTTGSWSTPFALTVSWAAITGMSPASGTETSDTTPTLSWTPVLGATRYEVRIADTAAGLDGAPSTDATAASYTPSTALTLKTHYWRVRALDSSGNAGAWSRPHSLTVNWGGIAGMSPATGSTTTDTTPTLSWAAVAGAARYKIQITDTAAGVVSAAETTVTRTSYTPSTALTNLKTHYWRVRALDSSGNAGAWSRTFSLRVNWGLITGMSPSSGSTTTDTTPTLSWTAVTGAARYTVQVADTAAGVPSATETSARSASHTPGTALTNAKTHYWRVRATDGDGQTGPWSGIHSLAVNWGAITGMEPPSGSGTTDMTPTLDWHTVTGASRYEVRIAETEAGLAQAASRTLTGSWQSYYTPSPALTVNKTHYWRVRAVAADGTAGAWSTASGLQVSWATISGMSPPNGALTTDSTPTLSWGAVTGATGYEVGIAESEAGLAGASPKRTTAASYTPGTALAYFKTQYWRVRPLKTGTPAGAWSPTFTFKVDDGFIPVSGGTFSMGTPSGGDYDERPVHRVTLSGFLMSPYEVTQDEYEAVVGDNPSYFPTGTDAGKRPVERVSWYDAVRYCNALSEKRGLEKVYTIGTGTSPTVTADWSKNGYRLPTEAEWEYAARGGSRSRGYTYSGSNTVGDVAWYYYNSSVGGSRRTHKVGGKQANELGLYDMSGNVWEWVWDRYGAYTSAAKTDPRGAVSGGHRVYRGGSWYNYARYVRSSDRNNYSPGGRDNDLGFRPCRTAD